MREKTKGNQRIRRRYWKADRTKGRGKLKGWDVIRLRGSRPGEVVIYLARRREGVTMPYRKVRSV